MNASTRKLASRVWSLFFHTLAVLLVTGFMTAPAMDLTRLAMLWESRQYGFELPWSKLMLHLGLGACTWALIVIAAMLVQLRRSQSKRKIVWRPTRGTVMTETLIVLVPLLLLTSGLAQLALLSTTGMLADLAAFNGARAAWVWLPERDAPRSRTLVPNLGSKYEDVRDRARTASALALAPTAPNDTSVIRPTADGSSERFRHNRAVVFGAFMPDNTSGVTAFMESGGAPSLAAGGVYGLDHPDIRHDSTSGDWSFVRSLDTGTMKERAARKVTLAEWGLWHDYEILDTGDRVGVRFTYYYAALFPWFQYLWGTKVFLPGTAGPNYYALIRREHTLARQPSMQ